MNDSAVKAISVWLFQRTGEEEIRVDEIADLIMNKMLVNHSCCDTQTFQFCDELYQETIV